MKAKIMNTFVTGSIPAPIPDFRAMPAPVTTRPCQVFRPKKSTCHYSALIILGKSQTSPNIGRYY